MTVMTSKMAMSRLKNLTSIVPMVPYLHRELECGADLLLVVALVASDVQEAVVADAVAVDVDPVQDLVHLRVAISSSFYSK